MDNNPSVPIPDAPQLSAAAEGGENVSEETVSLHQLVNSELGLNYPDDRAALQGLKETRSYVGKVGQILPYFDRAREQGIPTSKLLEAMDNIVNGQPAPQQAPAAPDTDRFVTKDELNRQLFYKDHTEYQPYQPIIDAMAATQGKRPDEVVQDAAFKSVFEQAQGFKEAEKSKSVLQTNSRLGAAADTMTKAAEALKTGDIASAQMHALDAVMDSYPIA